MKTKSSITVEQVKHIAQLANLPIQENELEQYQKHLSEILDLVNQLNALETHDVTPTSQVTGLENVLREDIVVPSLPQTEALTNAPRTHEGYFVVDAVLEEE